MRQNALRVEFPTVTARYRVVADRVVQDIRDGLLRPGDQLPSIERMRLEHGESRSVVVRAIEWLGERGWVRTEHGKASYIASDNPTVEPSPTRDERLTALERDVADLKAWRSRLEGNQ